MINIENLNKSYIKSNFAGAQFKSFKSAASFGAQSGCVWGRLYRTTRLQRTRIRRW